MNESGAADGLVGGHLPVVVFYFPLNAPCNSSSSSDDDVDAAASSSTGSTHHDANTAKGKPKPAGGCNPYLAPSARQGSRYWTMIAAPTPDMQVHKDPCSCCFLK